MPNHRWYRAGVLSCLLLSAGVTGDVVRHDPRGDADVSKLVVSSGLKATATTVETAARALVVPGEDEDVELTFTLRRLNLRGPFAFGFFPEDVPFADAVSEKSDWAAQALESARVVFDRREHGVGDRVTVRVRSGAPLAFFIIVRGDADSYSASPPAMTPDQKFAESRSLPLFTVSRANPGQHDQSLIFIGDDATLITFEATPRTVDGPADFADLAVSIDQALLPDQRPGAGIGIDWPELTEAEVLTMSAAQARAMLTRVAQARKMARRHEMTDVEARLAREWKLVLARVKSTR